MDPSTFVDPHLTVADKLVLASLLSDVERTRTRGKQSRDLPVEGDSGYESFESAESVDGQDAALPQATVTRRNRASHVQGELTVNDGDSNAAVVAHLKALNDPLHSDFVPTVLFTWDIERVQLPPFVDQYILQPYIAFARTVVRADADVVVLTHLLMYFTTIVPSALYLFYSFSWVHGVLHWLMQSWFVGSYTLMRHQHIHMNGVLAPAYQWFDMGFPYLLDPLMGHSWNGYYYHHVKHHHVEGNGPNDLSSTVRYQRDSVYSFMHYVGRFVVLVWLDLPLYFLRTGKTSLALKSALSEVSSFATILCLARFVNFRASLFTLILPLALLRVGLMVGNWGQHAFVDEVEPDSDYRSSITLIDVPSNRFCFNDGYHTSHHLNPRRHWRDHPVAFLSQKQKYAEEHALVFRNIDYIMLTIRLLRKDYAYLAKCLVPIGDQIGMSLDEIAKMLESKTRRFSEEDIKSKFT